MLQFLLTFLVSLLVAVAVLFIIQRALIYRPDARPIDLTYAEFERHETSRAPYWFKAGDPAKPIVVFFHGNAGNAQDRLKKLMPWTDAGHGLALFSYSGYANQRGRPTEKNLYADGQAVITHLLDNQKPEAGIILHGESLGTGVAMELALRDRERQEHLVKVLILEAPFASLTRLVTERFWGIPLGSLVRDPYKTAEKLPKLGSLPILILHGDRDDLVPIHHSLEMHEDNPEHVVHVTLEGAGHNDLHYFEPWTPIFEFLAAQGIPGPKS